MKQIDPAIESFVHTKNDVTVAALESMARDNGEFQRSVTHELETVVQKDVIGPLEAHVIKV